MIDLSIASRVHDNKARGLEESSIRLAAAAGTSRLVGGAASLSEGMRSMAITTRVAAAGVALLVGFALAATAAFAQTQSQSIKDRLAGHWQLVSIAINDTAPYGANPKGSMFLDAGGHYAIIVLSGGGARNISYFGTFTVDDADSSITMHIDGSSRANADGRDQKRLVAFNGDQLTVSTPASTGRKASIKLTWQRAN
jgi:hypothetical protein